MLDTDSDSSAGECPQVSLAPQVCAFWLDYLEAKEESFHPGQQSCRPVKLYVA